VSEQSDAAHWAKPVSSLHIAHDLPPDAVNLNVEGRRLAGLTGGFGPMWQKTYWIDLGDAATPEDVVREWKLHFAEFWPKGARFFKPGAGVEPGDVALINIKKAASPTVSTGIMVLYADDVSFSFMSPEGHPFVGMITFSARHEDGAGGGTVAQVQLFIRPADPISDVVMLLGGHRLEDNQWKHVLRRVAAHVGVTAEPSMVSVRVDRKRQWKHFGNIRRSSLLRSALYAFSKPFRLKRARV
jgi:hypothetical protein